MRIQVKKTHIRRGYQTSPDACAVALAIQESTGSSKVRVTEDLIRVGRQRIPTPASVQKFIQDFDDKKVSVAPFEFEL